MVGRKDDMKSLIEQYNSAANSLLVLYGRSGIGKTTLINEFIKDKKAYYYCLKDCNEREQQFILRDEWNKNYGIEPEGNEFLTIFESAVNKASSDTLESDDGNAKTVLILDEIYLAFKQGQDLLNAIKRLWADNKDNNNLMILLAASSVQWVENDMVKMLGEFATEITGLIKLKPFGFLEVVNRFPSISSKDAVYVYGILGGVPGYMDMWSAGKSVRNNVIDLFLDKNAVLYKEPERFLKTELRELAFYNTILYNLACGRNKLNELHERTGFSRAKISVYIRNLIELDIVEKVFSYDAKYKDNTKKGVYAIKDPMIHFWYRFIFPNLSELEKGNKEMVYDKLIKPELDEYMHKYFVRMCKEYMGLMSRYNKLPFNIEICESWHGKDCTIDIISKDEESGTVMAGMCKWSNSVFGEKDLEELIFNLDKAGEEANYYYLFSRAGFSEYLIDREKIIDSIVLTSLDTM